MGFLKEVIGYWLLGCKAEVVGLGGKMALGTLDAAL